MPFDAFLKIAGVDGESTDKGHEKWIEILSYSTGVSQAVGGSSSGGGGRNGQRCDVSDFSIVKRLDKTSPTLMLLCAQGDHIEEVQIVLCQATGDKQPYMTYTLSDVIISGVRPGGASQGGDSVPLEEVSFNPGKLEMKYTELDHKSGKSKGDVVKFWDTVTNTGG